MQCSLALLALTAAAANASPFAFPQAVTAIITPSGSAPLGCMPTFVGSFGIAVQNISTAAPVRRQVTEITEQVQQLQVHVMGKKGTNLWFSGQPQAPAATGMTSALTMPLVMSTIKTSILTTPSVVTTVKTSVLTTPSVVTTVKTSILTTPSVMTTITPSNMTTPVANATVKTSVLTTPVAVTTIKTSTMTAPAVVATVQTSVVSMMVPSIMTMASVSQFTDGQIQGGMHNMTVMPIVTSTAMSVITVAPVTEFTDGQPQAPIISVMPTTTTQMKVVPVSEFTDGQPQALMPTTAAPAMSVMTSVMTSVKPATTATAAPVSPPVAMGMQMVACQTNGTLALTLANGILKDSFGRTGYIASNFQFQFDNPPQSGALITAGFSVCANGSLALGGSNVFFQCLSGDFYNLYTENWAPQCSPVTINTVMLLSCMT